MNLSNVVMQTTSDNEISSSAQLWWESVHSHSDQFFEYGAAFKSGAAFNQLNQLLVNMEIIRHTIEEIAYPFTVMAARYHLLEAMALTLAGLHYTLDGDDKTASSYLNSAQEHLHHLDRELSWIE